MATKKNVSVNGHEYYRIRRKIDGVQKSFYGSSKGDAERRYREYVQQKAEEARQRRLSGVQTKFCDRADEFINEVLRPSQRYAQATKYRYELAYTTHIKDSSIAKMRASEIRPADIQRYYNALDVSKQTLATVNKFLSAMCRWMVRNEYSTDFMSAVEIPKKPENKRHEGIVTWEPDEIQTIIDELPGHRLYFFLYILLYTGARMSEAIALKHSDIYDNCVHIRRQHYMGEDKPPKYGSSRDIPMHEELAAAYEIHKAWQAEDMKKNGYETDLLFTTSTGKIYDPVNVRRALRRFCGSCGVPYKHPHAFRSTFCTQLCRCGVPLEVASSLMGHRSIEVTAQHYALVKKDTKEDAIAMLSYSI